MVPALSMPSGRFGMATLAGCVNLLLFGLPITFLREMTMDAFNASASLAALPPDGKFFAMNVMGNTPFWIQLFPTFL